MYTLLLLMTAAPAAPLAPQGLPVDATLGVRPSPAVAAPALHGARAAVTSASDDFNRPNSTSMGADWVEQAGDIEISNNQGHGVLSGSLMTHANAAVPYDVSLQRVSFSSQGGLVYLASVMGYASSSMNVFLKVQDNNSDGFYDRVFFYRGNNGGSWGASPYYFDLATPTASGVLTTYFTGGGDVAVMEIDNHASGSVEVFQAAGVLGFAGSLGQEHGIGTYGSAWFDDYALNPQSGPSLALVGSCPGLIGVDIGGMTPGGTVAIVAGVAGPFNMPAGRPCAGTDLGVDPLALPVGPIYFLVPADANGEVNLGAIGSAGPAACGLVSVVALDLTTCALTGVVAL